MIPSKTTAGISPLQLSEHKNPIDALWVGHNSSSAASTVGLFVSQGRALGFMSLIGFSGGDPQVLPQNWGRVAQVPASQTFLLSVPAPLSLAPGRC